MADPAAGELVFSKALKDSHIRGKFNWPMKSLNRLPHFNGGNRVHFVVANRHGQRWTLVCSKRTRPGSHPKPEVRGKSWLNFVREAHLRTGDELFFHDSQVLAGVNFTVRIVKRRTIKIFGQLIEATIEE